MSESTEPALDLLRDQLPYRIVRPYRVRFDESTVSETMRTAVQLAWIADIAWQHSVLLGFGREWYSQQNLFWLVRAVQFDVLAPIHTYDTVNVSTQVIGYRRVAARRRSEIRDDSGTLLTRAEIDWAMTNERGIPTRVPVDFHQFVAGQAATFDMHKVPLPETPPDAAERRFHVRRRDLDPLDHVNNSVYLDYFEQAVEGAGGGEMLRQTRRRYTLDFASSAARGERVVARTWQHERGWLFRLTREDGADIFRARLESLELEEDGRI